MPPRAFDELGVDSLRALNTPFLIESEAAVEAVLDDGIRKDLLAGLPAAGVVGLDLFPAGLRHPFGFDAPLLGAADYQDDPGAALSETVTQMFAALGATVTDAEASSQQRGAESAYAWAPGPIATGNVTYFPKVTTLGGRCRRAPTYEISSVGPAPGSRGRHARIGMFSAQASDLEDAAQYCADGGRIVAATQTRSRACARPQEPVVGGPWRRNASVRTDHRADPGS